MPKRSGKWYRNNEREVMQSLGFTPTPNSGSGWIVKEDGQSEDVICQLKSTDAGSIRISYQDIQKLEYNALVAHKIPVFAIQFIKSNEVFLLVRPQDVQELGGCINGHGHINTKVSGINRPESLLVAQDDIQCKPTRIIRSSNTARSEIRDELSSRYAKKERKAK